MANTPYAGNLTRVHWADPDGADIHLEMYQNEVESRFAYNAIFKSYSTQRSTAHKTNTYRFDRLGSSKVMSRKSGESPESQKVANDKVLIQVDTTLYIRNPVDYQDDWTAPDWLSDIGTNNGYEFAEMFDGAHTIQLIKSRSWKAPDYLKPSFNDPVQVADVVVDFEAKTKAEQEAAAMAIYTAHKQAVTELVVRKVPLTDMVTFVRPDVYSALIEHPKLLNAEFNVDASDYGGRRVVRMNGIPIVEVLCFPAEANTVDKPHPLGTAYNVTADDLKYGMLLFSKSRALVTVEAHPFESRFWDDKKEFTNVLDCFTMYNVGLRRPDTIVAVPFVAPTPAV